MSDGPHRSLNMRPNWKKVAAFADNCAFEPEQISEAVIPALGQDWRSDVPDLLGKQIGDAFGGQQDTLFPEHNVESLQKLRSVTAGHGFAQVLLDCAIQQANNGASGPDAAIQAGANALGIWGARCARQIEEHYHRKSSQARAIKVRSRIEQGIAGASVRKLSARLFNPSSQPAPRVAVKQTGLDDGVRL